MFTIDLNDPAQLTLDNVRLLLASKDDSVHRQLRVLNNGTAFLSDDVASQNIQGVRMRYETWIAGNGYSGEAAAADDAWVQTVFNSLKNDWSQGRTGLIEY